MTFYLDAAQADVAIFIENLESLAWTASKQVIRDVENMKTIFTACTHLKHINLARNIPTLRSDKIGVPPGSLRMNDFFRSFRGHLQTANLQYLTSEQIKVLAETSPNLTTIYLSVDHESVEALPLLLGTQCHQICESDLEYSRQTGHCFGKDSSDALLYVIRSARPCFHTVPLVDDFNSSNVRQRIW